MNDRFRRLTDEEMTSLRKEMQEAGEWAKGQLQQGEKPAEFHKETPTDMASSKGNPRN